MSLQDLQAAYQRELEGLNRLQLQPPSGWSDTTDDFRQQTAADKVVKELDAVQLSGSFAEVVALEPSVLDEESFNENLREMLQYVVAVYLQDQTFASIV